MEITGSFVRNNYFQALKLVYSRFNSIWSTPVSMFILLNSGLRYVLFNKLTSVFYASVLLLMINFVITLSKWLWNHESQAFFTITRPQNGQVPGINEGERRRKLAGNKDK